MIEKLLIIGFAAATLLWWLRYHCRLILEASSCPVPRRVRRLLVRLQRTRRPAVLSSLLVLLYHECCAPAVERCRSCGAACVGPTCERVVLLANFCCLACCCLFVSRVSQTRSRLVAEEMASIASYLAQREPAPLALQ